MALENFTAAQLGSWGNGAVPGRTVDLDEGAKVVTHRQLSDHVFYSKVRAGLLDGSVNVVDHRTDALRVGDQVIPLTDVAALEALSASQEQWVGQPNARPFLDHLMGRPVTWPTNGSNEAGGN